MSIDTPQQTCDAHHGLLLIDELIRHGWLEGGFTVNREQVTASIKLLAAVDGVVAPTRERAVEMAIGIMKARGPLPDEHMLRTLLEGPDVKWPPVQL